MKIFPTSSTLSDLVNYINIRTDSHKKVYDFFKKIVLSPDDVASLSVNFTERDQYFNSKFPIDDTGRIIKPEDTFGGRYLPNNPIITTFSNYPNTNTVPNINEGKPEQSIDIDGGIPSNISISTSTMSSLSNSTYTKNESVKYWPTFKINDFFPISSGLSNIEQLNVNGYSVSDSLFSILKITPGVNEKYHHINIEYSTSDPKAIMLVLLDGKHIVDGDSVEFKISFNKTDIFSDINKWPIIIFIDSSYVNISVDGSFNLSTLHSETQSLIVDGISYRYVPAELMDNELYKYVRIPNNEQIGYLVSINSLDQIFLNKIGISNIVKFNGTSNTIKYDNYGYLDSELLRLDYNTNFTLVTRPILGKGNLDVLNESAVEFSDNLINFTTFNNSCAVFGAQTNTYSYNLSTYNTSTTLSSIKTTTNYLPVDYPKQMDLQIINFNSELESGIFYTFDISANLIGNNYYIINTGVQFINSFFSIRKHSNEIIIENAGIMTNISTTTTSFSVDIGYKRLIDKMYRRILLRSYDSLIYDSGWVLDNLISDYDCNLSDISSPFIENYQVCDLDLTNKTNTVTVSNILLFSKLNSVEVDTLFQLSIINGVYNRFSNRISPTPKIIPITQLEGFITALNQYPKSNIAISNVNNLNATYGNTEYRIGFTVHDYKGDFNYRKIKSPLLGSSLLENQLLIGTSICPDFSDNTLQANISCDGILNIDLMPYFSSTSIINGQNSKSSQTPYNSKILNKDTIISFGKCGYLPRVSTTITYTDKSTNFIFDNGTDAIYNPHRSGLLQSLAISEQGPQRSLLPINVLSQNPLQPNNTINRLLFYVNPTVTINNKNSTLPDFFNVNYGDTINTFSKINDTNYIYSGYNGFIGTMILAPNVNNINDVESYKGVRWQLRLITKTINPETVTFSSINLNTDTIVLQTITTDMVYYSPLKCGLFSVGFNIVNIEPEITKYVLNGFMITLETENINTDGTRLDNVGSAKYNYLIINVFGHIPNDNNNIVYDIVPEKTPPNYTNLDKITPLGVNNFKSLESEYINDFRDYPSINNLILSTYYQIPKYSK